MKQALRIAALIAGTVVIGACASVQNQSGRTSPNAELRVVNGESYRVVRAEPLVLYARERNVLSGKRFAVVVDRFFSTSPTAPVRPLTLESLKQAYPDNHKFHDLLTLAFRSDAELLRYDDHHNEYLVARLLRVSLPVNTALSSAR